MLRFRRRKRVPTNLSIAPLVDVVLLLLIFFMLSSSFIQPTIKIELPEGRSRETTRQQDIVVTVDSTGRMFVNLEEVMSLEDLQAALVRRFEEAGHKAIALRGDRKVPYGVVVKVVDRARRAGAETIELAHGVEIE